MAEDEWGLEEFGPDHVRLEAEIRKNVLIRDIEEYLSRFKQEYKEKYKRELFNYDNPGGN